MLPEFFSAAFGNDADGARGKIGEQEIIGMLQMKNDRVLIGGIDRINHGKRCGLAVR